MDNRFSCTLLFKLMKSRKLQSFLLAIYQDSDGDNQSKDLKFQLQISLAARSYSQTFIQQLKTIIHEAVLDTKAISFFTWCQLARENKCKQQCQTEKLFPFLHGTSQQGKINVKTVHFEVVERKNKKDAGQKNSTRES